MDGDLQKFNKQLAELNQKKIFQPVRSLAAVDVKEAMNTSFHLSYLVNQSEWYPTYDIRVQDIAKPLTSNESKHQTAIRRGLERRKTVPFYRRSE